MFNYRGVENNWCHELVPSTGPLWSQAGPKCQKYLLSFALSLTLWQWFLLQAYHHQYSSQFLYQTNSYNQRSFVLAEHIFHRQLFSCCKHQTIKRLIRLIKINTWYDSTRVQHTLVHIYTNFRRVKSSRTMKHFTPSSLILKGPSVRQIIHL